MKLEFVAFSTSQHSNRVLKNVAKVFGPKIYLYYYSLQNRYCAMMIHMNKKKIIMKITRNTLRANRANSLNSNRFFRWNFYRFFFSNNLEQCRSKGISSHILDKFPCIFCLLKDNTTKSNEKKSQAIPEFVEVKNVHFSLELFSFFLQVNSIHCWVCIDIFVCSKKLDSSIDEY